MREPRLLDSRTPGVAFEMTGSAYWKARKKRHPDIEAVIRDTVTKRAQAIASVRYADDVHGAQDAINAALGTGHHERNRYYSNLTGRITLQLNKQGMANALEYRATVARLERLHFLKKQLYSDPSMLILDYLENHPQELTGPPDLDHFQRLALKISNGEEWWCRILDVLDKLSANVPEGDGNLFAMNVLIATLKTAAPDLLASEESNPQSCPSQD